MIVRVASSVEESTLFGEATIAKHLVHQEDEMVKDLSDLKKI